MIGLPGHRTPTPPHVMLIHEFLGPWAADSMGVSYDWMRDFLEGRERVTPEIAAKLAGYTRVSQGFWLGLQADIDEYRQRLAQDLAEHGEGMGS